MTTMPDRSLQGPNYFSTLDQIACVGVSLIMGFVVIAVEVMRGF